MNEDDLRLIRRSTRSAEVNTRQKKMPKKRGTLQRQKARSELFDNKNINYQKHMREFQVTNTNTLTGVFLLEKIMKIKLIDVQTEVEEDVEFGTCELCMQTGSAEFPTFIFEKEDGSQFEVLG